jgi:hypothetical protein
MYKGMMVQSEHRYTDASPDSALSVARYEACPRVPFDLIPPLLEIKPSSAEFRWN